MKCRCWKWHQPLSLIPAFQVSKVNLTGERVSSMRRVERSLVTGLSLHIWAEVFPCENAITCTHTHTFLYGQSDVFWISTRRNRNDNSEHLIIKTDDYKLSLLCSACLCNSRSFLFCSEVAPKFQLFIVAQSRQHCCLLQPPDNEQQLGGQSQTPAELWVTQQTLLTSLWVRWGPCRHRNSEMHLCEKSWDKTACHILEAHAP